MPKKQVKLAKVEEKCFCGMNSGECKCGPAMFKAIAVIHILAGLALALQLANVNVFGGWQYTAVGIIGVIAALKGIKLLIKSHKCC